MNVIFQSGAAIFGVGQTLKNARRDAAEWLDGGMDSAAKAKQYIQGSAVDGVLYYARCTPRLAAKVAALGGDISYEIDVDGVVDLVDE